MNHQTEENYSFCPKCGSLMENGVCPECAKQQEQGVYSSQNFPRVFPEQPETSGVPAANQQQPGQYQQEAYQGLSGQYPQGTYQGQPGQYAQNGGTYQGQPGQYPQSGYQDQGGQYQQGMYQGSYYGQYAQGGYQGQPGMYPGSGYGQPMGQNAGFQPYGKPEKKKNIWLTLGIVAAVVIVILMIVGSFFYGYFFMKMASMSPYFYEDSYDFNENRNRGSDDEYVYGGYDEDDDEDYYTPSPDDVYYYGPCDAIDEDVDYSFVTKSYTNEDPDNDIDVVINYFQLKGDSIPNIDQLNEALETVALYYAMDFPRYSSYAEYGESYTVYITSYVTYNDADMISIVLDEYIMVDDRYHVDLYPINIDIKNGVILDNDSLLQIDTAFAEEFRERNDEQNGPVEYLDALSDEELAQSLQDRDSMIAYYTPLGMEIGLNYDGAGSSGWVTVTYKDYEKYLSKF